jgi:RNA polymerase sigma-70 factor (ECF subfamily)
MPAKPFGRRFETTRWNVVLAAAGAATPDSRAALATLCEQYWYPLYAYLRASGHTASDAEDLAQGFFLRLLEKDALQAVDPERGRFRSFLLAALKHFAANEWDRSRAQKRGGPHPPLPLELWTGEERYRIEPRVDSTPESAYDRQWAQTVLDRAASRLRGEFTKAGKEHLFRHLEIHLMPEENGPPYADTAAASGMTEGAVRVAVHRLRRRYRELLEDEIAQTVASPEQVQDEIRHLIVTIGR